MILSSSFFSRAFHACSPLLLAIVLFPGYADAFSADQSFDIFFSNSIVGELESCGG